MTFRESMHHLLRGDLLEAGGHIGGPFVFMLAMMLAMLAPILFIVSN
jgi:hypothetical protein